MFRRTLLVFLKQMSEQFKENVDYKVRPSSLKDKLILFIEPYLYRGLMDLSSKEGLGWRKGSVSL